MQNDKNVPKHVAIIMDGNGRWAKNKNLPISKGHTEGTKRIEEVVAYAASIGIEYVTIYAFSTENWKREESEISHLLKLVKVFYKNKINKMVKDGIKINVIGSEENVPTDILKLFRQMEEKSKNNNKLILNIAFNYGAKEEIVNAVNNIIKEGKDIINEEQFSSYLYTKDMPQVDLLIRSSGEKRISNFLLWQVAYAEFVFEDTLWPDFDASVFEKCLQEYNDRSRRFGGR